MPRPRMFPEGLGEFGIPYDQSGGYDMTGMDIPNPGGAMKKLSLEFADAQDAAAQAQQPQIPAGAGIPPAGMQGGAPPAGMQPAATPDMGGGAPPMGMGGQPAGGGLFEGMGQQAPDSSMFSDEDLAMMAQGDPAQLMGQDMNDQLMDPNVDPQTQQMLQMQLMEAARRQMGGF